MCFWILIINCHNWSIDELKWWHAMIHSFWARGLQVMHNEQDGHLLNQASLLPIPRHWGDSKYVMMWNVYACWRGGDSWKHQLHGVDCRGIELHEHLLSLVPFKVLIPSRCTGSGFDQAIVIQQGAGFGKRTHGPMATCPMGASSNLRTSVMIEIMDHRF